MSTRVPSSRSCATITFTSVFVFERCRSDKVGQFCCQRYRLSVSKENVDIQFSAHDVFLEYTSSGTVRAKCFNIQNVR